ncbi:MAG: HAD-IB family phosphatase [bacterium]
MISIIIPVLNEERTIGSVIDFCKKSSETTEIIVIDDKSIDETVNIAISKGVKIYTSTKLGKGSSMKDGFLISKGDIVLFLDGDIADYPEGTIENMTSPIKDGRCDFTKSYFSREAGRVTELVAKPLLSILFPELSRFKQPLSGIIAGRRELFEKIEFENDYGVDIGILIDIYKSSAKIEEVFIGNIEHKMKQWQELSAMSKQVSKAILKRSSKNENLNLDSLGTVNIIKDQMDLAIKEMLLTLKKMVVFDLDDTIYEGRFLYTAAKELGFYDNLMKIMLEKDEPYVLTKRVATLFKGVNIAKFYEIAESIKIIDDTIDVVRKLKEQGFIVGIISESYDIVAEHVRKKIGADFALANEIEFSESVATGEVKIPAYFMKNDRSVCSHNYCKTNAMLNIAEKYGISISNIIAVGDSERDICIVKTAGIGVSFCSMNLVLNYVADKVIQEKRFQELLNIAL